MRVVLLKHDEVCLVADQECTISKKAMDTQGNSQIGLHGPWNSRPIKMGTCWPKKRVLDRPVWHYISVESIITDISYLTTDTSSKNYAS